MSRLFFNPHLKDVISRLPTHYKEQYLKAQRPKRPNYLQPSESLLGRTLRTQNLIPGSHFDVPPTIIYPPESQKCLWHGEGIVSGYARKSFRHPLYPKMYPPKLSQQVFYSDILNRWMVIIVSETALRAIEKAGCLDAYILSTPAEQLNSRLGMHLKRDLLLHLSDPNFCSENPEKGKTLRSKYSQYIIPRSEAEWVGLTLEEAVKKQMKLETEAAKSRVRPQKYDLVEKVFEELESPKTSAPTSTNLKGVLSRILHGEKDSRQ
ncbi:hypothetical protein CRM22_001502 [Opisthorchis felineus]|uniref:Large ribosomal subunit protein bL28m n=1 Tax=Opisthorchis felineus TaxID=147828 RepID=A0A4S2MAI4_OPIFE|nr:hypothetical protein CRM22_001502 [Opisthorchis felineus]